MSRFSLSVSFNNPETAFPLMDAIANVLMAQNETLQITESESINRAPSPTAQIQAPAPQAPSAPVNRQRDTTQGPTAPTDQRPVPSRSAQAAQDTPTYDTGSTASDKQVALISTLMQRRNVTEDMLFAWMDANMRVIDSVTELTKSEASALIDAIQAGRVADADAPF